MKLMFQKKDEEHHEAFAFLELEGGNLELLQALDEDNQPVPFDPPRDRKPILPTIWRWEQTTWTTSPQT